MQFFRNICLLVFVASLQLGCIANTISFNEGIKSFKVQDYRQAFIRLKPVAERGNPEAQYAVGYMYYYGQGVTEDRQKAWFWITLAAAAGQPDAIAATKILKRDEK